MLVSPSWKRISPALCLLLKILLKELTIKVNASPFCGMDSTFKVSYPQLPLEAPHQVASYLYVYPLFKNAVAFFSRNVGREEKSQFHFCVIFL